MAPVATREDARHARPFPPEFRQRAVELATTSDKPLGEVAKGLGISRSCLQDWLRQQKTDTNDDSPEWSISADT